MTWDERVIATAISRQTLDRKCVVLVDNCSWTGYECDVLGVTTDLRIIDVEVKISRADLKADAKKDKWWQTYFRDPETGRHHSCPPQPRTWPVKVWKHYYAMPADIWKPELLGALPSEASGVILMKRRGSGGIALASVERRATPCKDAYRLSPAEVMDIARLANLRMWSAYEQLARRAA